MPIPNLVEIRAAALRTLTSIIHLDRNPHLPNRKPGSRLNMIIDVTGAGSYHGFLPALVRTCIMTLTSSYSDTCSVQFPLPLATALFSFLYHLASYEAGGEALVSCGMMESLLRVINWPGTELEHITFVTRAVRVIDLITNIDMQAFQMHGGLTSFISRLEVEVTVCRKEQPFEITFSNSHPEIQDPHGQGFVAQGLSSSNSSHNMVVPSEENVPSGSEQSTDSLNSGTVMSPMEVILTPSQESSNCRLTSTPMQVPRASTSFTYVSNESALTSQVANCLKSSGSLPDYSAARTGKTCLPQRAALLKSMLNFLKKAIQDPAFSDSIRHVMEGSLPSSLKHIISNAEYYGPSLFLLATDVVTVYVFQEPSLLSSLQDSGLTDVVLQALLVKDVPATREVLGSLPNVFSALCLNARGLDSFVQCSPFNRLFKVLLSPVYLAAMRRRRSSDPMGDTASNLGNAMDELMRHQPSLKVDAMYAIIKLLEELCVLGRDPKYICWRAQNKMDVTPAPAPRPSGNNEGGSSDEEDEDEEEASTSSHPQREDAASDSSALHEKTPIALIDYILNVMKFVDAILSNNSTDDHCREFVAQNGLVPLLSILGLPNLPVDYPVATAAQAVASVCKSILNLAHEPRVLREGLHQLSKVLEQLQPLHSPVKAPGSSVLLHELASAPNLDSAFTSAAATPLLHAMGAAHGYVIMFVHVCRTGQVSSPLLK
ncbi:E3 ubiquitin-protein ligase HUWE1 [Zootermopsis nevadensis]|uniref:E3 ubiquitin-protein ligase HUWE1 n=2 Tax=Zootermopsis nevadensis TaxID=136037 RepID=A0A067QEZ5_ZOONE|nr:E3 ubiquitin-protein ligase HUWE1 [Zootermopsis nevadensis]